MTKQIDLKALLESKTANITPAEGAATIIERASRAIPKNLMLDTDTSEFETPQEAFYPTARGLTVEEAKTIDDEMNRFIDTVLVSGVDYGIIPHCSKPTLLKSGAEKILNYLSLIARTEVSNRVEDYDNGFFSYEIKVYLLDYNGVVRGEGIGITNTKENKYAKSNGYSVQNVVLKMAKKRALVDAVLNVGSLSSRFTQDVEDMNIEPEQVRCQTPNAPTEPRYNQNNNARPATAKQIAYLERLLAEAGSSAQSLNRYCQQNYCVDDYRKATSFQVSELIEKFKAAANRG